MRAEQRGLLDLRSELTLLLLLLLLLNISWADLGDGPPCVTVLPSLNEKIAWQI